MPRVPRIQFPGAFYHIINRGNYRSAIFAEDGAKHAFEQALFEALERFGWSLRAYVLMDNHFHLCLETPEPNLVSGMQWLESVFAHRFNRFRGERGHVFQGRYKALLVEPGESVLRVVDYIHLNPVKAKLVKVDRLGEYAWSSFGHLRNKGTQVDCAAWLKEAGGWTDTTAGLRAYGRYLERKAESLKDRSSWRRLDTELTRGWFIGSDEGKEEIVHWWSQQSRVQLPRMHGQDHARKLLKDGLREMGKSRGDLSKGRLLEPWKVELAGRIRQQTGVTLGWLSQSLVMGDVSNLSRALLSQNKGKK